MAPNITEILFALGPRRADRRRDPFLRLIRRRRGPSPRSAASSIRTSRSSGRSTRTSSSPSAAIPSGSSTGSASWVCPCSSSTSARASTPSSRSSRGSAGSRGRKTGRPSSPPAFAAGSRPSTRPCGASLSRPRVFVLLYGQGLWTCGGESYVDDLIARAGGTNVASALPKKWVLYKRERIIKDDPDVIFILARSAGDFAAGRDRLAADARHGRRHGRRSRAGSSSSTRTRPAASDRGSSTSSGRMAGPSPSRTHFGGRA